LGYLEFDPEATLAVLHTELRRIAVYFVD